jgi:hypothetical protein
MGFEGPSIDPFNSDHLPYGTSLTLFDTNNLLDRIGNHVLLLYSYPC